MFQAVVDPVAGNLALSALVACIPLAAFFVMLVGVKAKAHISAFVALVVALVVAIFAFGMPANLAVLSGLQGACYGAFPIVFIIIMAVWFYEVTVVSGRSEDLKSLFDIVGGGDIRIQAVLVAFCFGGLLEALAGFGAPIAITATMILALGVKPSKAALAVLIANTAPVAYGAAGTPITTAGNMVAGGDASVALESAQHVAAIVGYQAPLFALFVPLLVVLILDGKKGLRDCWMHALLITAIPAGTPVHTNSGTVQLYSDLMYSGMCTTHTTPPEPTPDPDAPDDGSGDAAGGDNTGGDSGAQTPSDGTGTAGDSAGGETTGDNGQFLNWLLSNGSTSGRR